MYHATIDKVHTFTGYYNENSHSLFKWVCQCSCGWIHVMGGNLMAYSNADPCHWINEEKAKLGFKLNHLDKLHA